MHVNAQVMGNAVHIIFVQTAFLGNQPQLHAALCQHLPANVVQLSGGHAGLCLGGDFLVGTEYHLINGTLAVGEFSVYRVGSGDVGAVAIHPAAQIQQQEAAIGAGVPVGFIVQHTAVFAASGDGGEGGTLRALVVQHVLVVCLCLIFLHAGGQGGHHGFQPLPCHLDGLGHFCNLVAVLLHPQHRRHPPQIPHGDAGEILLELLCFHQVVVGQVTQPVAVAVKIARLEIVSVQHILQQRLKPVNKPHVLNAGNLLGFGDSDHLARPALGAGVCLLDEQHRSAASPCLFHEENHVLPAQTGEIEEILVFFKKIVGIGAAVGSLAGVENQQGVVLHLAEHGLPSCFVIHWNIAPFLSDDPIISRFFQWSNPSSREFPIPSLTAAHPGGYNWH